MIKINNCLINNKLYISIQKTNHLILNNVKDDQLDIFIGNKVIDQLEYVNFCVYMLIPN